MLLLWVMLEPRELEPSRLRHSTRPQFRLVLMTRPAPPLSAGTQNAPVRCEGAHDVTQPPAK